MIIVRTESSGFPFTKMGTEGKDGRRRRQQKEKKKVNIVPHPMLPKNSRIAPSQKLNPILKRLFQLLHRRIKI